MTNSDGEKIYLTKHYSFFEKILLKKRKEILNYIKRIFKQ